MRAALVIGTLTSTTISATARISGKRDWRSGRGFTRDATAAGGVATKHQVGVPNRAEPTLHARQAGEG